MNLSALALLTLLTAVLASPVSDLSPAPEKRTTSPRRLEGRKHEDLQCVQVGVCTQMPETESKSKCEKACVDSGEDSRLEAALRCEKAGEKKAYLCYYTSDYIQKVLQEYDSKDKIEK